MSRAACRRAAAVCGAAAATALFVRLWLAPAGPRVFYDEYEHLDLAWNLASRGVFAGSMAWIPGELDVFRRPLWPPLAHLHYAALFLATGLGESGVWALNAALSAAACAAAGAAAFAWLGSPLAAGLTALLLAFSPTHAAYARTADLASVASLWTALAWLAALRGGPWTAGLALALAVQARPDGLLLLPPLLWLLSRHGRRALGPSALAALSALLPLSIAWSARAAGHDGYGDAWATLLARAPRQALENAWFFLRPDSPRLPLALAAAAGFWRARRERFARALALSVALYFGLYSAYSTAAFANGSGDKYALALELPLALLAAPLFAAPPALLAGGLAVYAALSAHAFRPVSSVHYAASDAFLRRLEPFVGADAPPMLTFVPPAPKVVLGAAVVHPRLLLEQGPAKLDPRGRGFLLLRDDSWRFQPKDAAALEALVRALYREETLLAESRDGRSRSLSRLTLR